MSIAVLDRVRRSVSAGGLAAGPTGVAARLAPALALAAAPFVFAVLARAGDGPGFQADDYGQYLMHAEALAEGRPYGDIGYIYTPSRGFLGPALAPPGLPLVLAPVIAVFGRNLLAIKAVLVVFAIAFVVLAGMYFATHEDRRLGLAAALLCGLSADLVHASTQALTDVPFAALVWAVILVYDRPGPWGVGRILWASFFVGWALLFRSIGVVLLPAVLLFTVVRFREHGIRPAIPALVVALCGALALAARPGPMPGLEISLVGMAKSLLESELIERNLEVYRLAIAESHLYPFPMPLANDLYHILSAVVMVVGLVAWLRRSWRSFAAVFTGTYTAALVLLPLAQERYLWPLFPVAVFGLVKGISLVASRLARARSAGWETRPAMAFAIVVAAIGVAQVVTQPRREGLAELPGLQAVFGYLKSLQPGEDVRVVFFKPRMFAWESGIPAMPTLRGAPDAILAELADRRISHIVLWESEERMSGGGPVAMRRLMSDAPDAFPLEFHKDGFAVYRFLPAALATPPDEVAR